MPGRQKLNAFLWSMEWQLQQRSVTSGPEAMLPSDSLSPDSPDSESMLVDVVWLVRSVFGVSTEGDGRGTRDKCPPRMWRKTVDNLSERSNRIGILAINSSKRSVLDGVDGITRWEGLDSNRIGINAINSSMRSVLDGVDGITRWEGLAKGMWGFEIDLLLLELDWRNGQWGKVYSNYIDLLC